MTALNLQRRDPALRMPPITPMHILLRKCRTPLTDLEPASACLPPKTCHRQRGFAGLLPGHNYQYHSEVCLGYMIL